MVQLTLFSLLIEILKELWKTIIQTILPYKMQKMKSINGKRVLITGSGSGLGRQLAIEFGKLGAELILWDINVKGNEETVRILKNDYGAQAKSYKIDLSKPKEIHKVAENVKKDFKNVDILINNAGIITGKLIMECSDQDIEKSFAVNAKAHFYTVRNFLPEMLEKNDGHIVTIASVAGKIPCAGLLMSSGKTGIKTTLVCPYFIHTPMFNATGAETRFPTLIPILEVEYVANQIVDAIRANRPSLILPKMFYLISATNNLIPSKVKQLIGECCGIFQEMNRFNAPVNVTEK